jgi:hypothetical protein
MDLEVSVHGYLAMLLWACGNIDIMADFQDRGEGLPMAARRQRERERERGKGWSSHSPFKSILPV